MKCRLWDLTVENSVYYRINIALVQVFVPKMFVKVKL